MDDYISREAALKRFEQLKDQTESLRDKLYLDGVAAVIDTLPAADVAPVIHARWEDRLDGITPFCTACGCAHNCLIRHPPYCPHCGAIMDLKEKQT